MSFSLYSITGTLFSKNIDLTHFGLNLSFSGSCGQRGTEEFTLLSLACLATEIHNTINASITNLLCNTDVSVHPHQSLNSIVSSSSWSHPNHRRIQVIVDGSCKDNQGVVGGLILDNNKLQVCWSIQIGPFPSSDYVEEPCDVLEGLGSSNVSS